MLLRGKTAIVTGGGRGIGRAIALRFAAEGAAVLVTARTVSEIEAVSAEIGRAGGKAIAVAADVSREEDCRRIVETARHELAPVDILVNNAGIFGPVEPVEQISPRDWDRVLAVNLRGAFLLARLVLPEMYERRSGVILNISSMAAKAALACNAPYAASKAGLAALTRSLAAEATRKGVRVNAICPGIVAETRMSKELGLELARHAAQPAKKLLADALEGTLLGRAVKAEEVAALAVFLVSDEAAVITGQAVNADGGVIFD